jgi:hypothetical protein
VNAIVALVVIVQMWLLTAALESFLAGHHEAALPAAIFSGSLFGATALLFRYVRRIDREVRRR